jgi:hypothetical protein
MASAGLAGAKRCIANIGQCADQGIDRRHAGALVRAQRARMKQQTDLLADCFEEALEAYPGATEAIGSANLPEEQAMELYALFRATAALWERWERLGAAIKQATTPTTIQ